MSEERKANTEDRRRALDYPKRFYEKAGVLETDAGYAVILDGRPAKTPGKYALCVPHRAVATALAGEYAAQGEVIVPATMPLTRLVNSALDTVAAARQAVADEIASYAGSDLVCYRAESPEGLVVRQCEHWDGLLAWAASELGVEFVPACGIMHVDQPEASVERARSFAQQADDFALAALYTITTLTGSTLIAFAVAYGAIGAEAAWLAAHVDEDWQIEHWGVDSEAERRRRSRRVEFDAACRLLQILGITRPRTQ